ncbi:phage tail assembly chaperone [Alteripontixanthobacter maritimus]|uniref:phage tail assembly chaperone n=1 Tax=Alteripontixanthobacter maritimus TaxID=2161824 RepID=UPI0011C071A5|nr:hypothetical protein [Alteripontixanthobacter maritimus]
MPDLPPGESLPDHWREVGYAMRSPTGDVQPFTWSEIDAYSRTAGANLTAFEARCLMDMSRAYVRGITDTRPLSIEPMERDYD